MFSSCCCIHLTFVYLRLSILPCSGQTLALAEPEARHYNRPATARRPPPAAPQQMFVLAISQPFLNGMSWNFAWLLFRWKGWSLQTITQPFLIGLRWNLVRCKQSSLVTKQWPSSTAVFHAALQNLYFLLAISQAFLNGLSSIFFRIVI